MVWERKDQHYRSIFLKKQKKGINVSDNKELNEKDKFWGGSPNELVYENSKNSGLIEVKNVLNKENFNLSQAAEKMKNFC